MAQPEAPSTSTTQTGGRTLRFLTGFLLVAYLLPISSRLAFLPLLLAVLLVLVLIAAYSLLSLTLSRRDVQLNRWVGAGLALAPVIVVYLLGGPGGILFGLGEGQLAALAFLAISLIVAAIRGHPGCEVMALPALLLRQRTCLACLLFSPVDTLEQKLRSKRAL